MVRLPHKIYHKVLPCTLAHAYILWSSCNFTELESYHFLPYSLSPSPSCLYYSLLGMLLPQSLCTSHSFCLEYCVPDTEWAFPLISFKSLLRSWSPVRSFLTILLQIRVFLVLSILLILLYVFIFNSTILSCLYHWFIYYISFLYQPHHPPPPHHQNLSFIQAEIYTCVFHCYILSTKTCCLAYSGFLINISWTNGCTDAMPSA